MFHPGMQKDTCNFLSENTFMTALLAFNFSLFNFHCLLFNNCAMCTVHERQKRVRQENLLNIQLFAVPVHHVLSFFGLASITLHLLVPHIYNLRYMY